MSISIAWPIVQRIKLILLVNFQQRLIAEGKERLPKQEMTSFKLLKSQSISGSSPEDGILALGRGNLAFQREGADRVARLFGTAALLPIAGS